MIVIEVDYYGPLFFKRGGTFYSCLSPDALTWLTENVGPYDPEPSSGYGSDVPATRPGHWDVLRMGGSQVFVRFHDPKDAVMFKLRWAESVIL